MSDPSIYTYPSPLEGYENLPRLSEYVQQYNRLCVSGTNNLTARKMQMANHT